MSDAIQSGYDVVIVGGGTAGCILAARLSEEPNRSVLLLEAGAVPASGADFPAGILDAGKVPGAQPDRPENWVIPGFITTEREYAVTRGKILGGSSATNGGYFIRPRQHDFLEWAQTGGPDWGYDRALPRMRALENDLDFGSTPLHGAAGPLTVTRSSFTSSATETFAAAATELGFATHQDMNDDGDAGFGAVTTNTVDGVRQNTALSLLELAQRRENLTIWGDAVVERVSIVGTRATGVVLRRGGNELEVTAGDVILAAGALSTPQLLMLSGIGAADELATWSLPCIVDAPGVGRGLSDHPQLFGEWMPVEAEPVPAGTWMGGVLHTGDDAKNIEVLQSLRSLPELVGYPTNGSIALLLATCTPRRSGMLRLQSADVLVPPVVHYGYMEDADIRADLRDAARLLADLLASAAVSSQTRWVTGPQADDLRSDVALDAWVYATVGTSMHACATASFAGPSPVVDPEGRVLGVTGLRIADTSILPAAPRRGPATAAALIGETIADLMP